MNKFLLYLLILFSVGYRCSASVTTKPDTGIVTLKAGTTLDEFNQLLNTDKYVLVDFYADWCIPCKQLTPVIMQLYKEMGDKLIVFRVNQDDNKPLMDKLVVDELPTILIYKNKTIKWTGIGYMPIDKFEEQLK